MTNPSTSLLLLLGLLISQSAQATDALQCRPIATSEKALPEICTTDSYREELAAFINLGSVYQADGARWTDRIELWPDLSENQVVFGNGRTTLRMNAYLRTRDLKDLMESIRPRLNLLKASPEFSKKMKALVAQQKEARLNLTIPLRLLLDTPFTGPGASLEVAELTETNAKSIVKLETTTTDQIQSQKADEPAPSSASLAQNFTCKDQIAALIQSKEDAEEQVKSLEQALAELSAKPTAQPSAIKKQKNRSLAAIAEDIQESDCDKCDQALAFCKSNRTLSNSVRKKNGCRQVFTTKACYLSVPAPFLIAVENCRGTHPRQITQLLQGRGVELKKKITELNRALEKKDQECAAEAQEST